MEKRLKLRIYRAIANTLESCRSKNPSILPHDPVPVPTPSFPPRSAANHHHHHHHFQWQKDDEWHVVAKIHQPHITTFAPPPPPPPPSAEKNRRRRKSKKSRVRRSTSSEDSGWLSEETETLLVSSPELRVSQRPGGAATAGEEAPARLSVFKKLIPCRVEGKVKESFAVVKRSENPYEDFRSSMVDMILEKQMFDPAELEQLLQCFLSLNSSHYHALILQAFSHIWDAIFFNKSSLN